MLTLRQSMELAGTNLLHCLRPDNDFLPLWALDIDPDMRAKCVVGLPEHNIGRWWDALLRLEAATGFAIPTEMEAAMLRHLESCLDNPLSICASMNREESCFDGHSQREILLALATRVRHRNCEMAAEAGHRMILALDRFIRDDGIWDRVQMNEIAGSGGRHVNVTPPEPEADLGEIEGDRVVLTRSHGRLVEGLLEFYMATDDSAALGLAARLAEFHYAFSTRPDGTVPQTDKPIHTLSLFGTYRGLLMYGRLTRQHEYIERIAKTYAVTVRTHVKQSGFISHDWGSEIRGETTSPGDAAQLAVWLARLGYSEFLDDAERIVRARILPSQITKSLGLQPVDGEDAPADLDNLAVGAFGGMHRYPHGGIRPTTDITAADLHTLCDIYCHIAEETDLGMVVNFHFDYEDERVRIESSRGSAGWLVIQPKIARPLAVRIPAWAPRNSVKLTVRGRAESLSWAGPFLIVSAPDALAQIEVGYDLPVQTLDECTDSVDYRITWRGDDVVGIAPNTDSFPSTPQHLNRRRAESNRAECRTMP